MAQLRSGLPTVGCNRPFTVVEHPPSGHSGSVPGSGKFCTLCRASDHLASNCALTYLHETGSGPGTGQSATPSLKPEEQFRRRPESALSICVSWNKGNCIYPGTCNYRHICATCHQQHMARDCTQTPDDSEYKKRPRTYSCRRLDNSVK